VIVLLLAVTAYAESDWVSVPGGLMLHKSCIHSVPDGTLVDDSFNDTCAYPAKQSNAQVYAIDVHFTASSGIMTDFNASFNAPGLPKQAGGQVVYFWPGFKSTQPTMGFPVLQPVLQYGRDSEGGGNYWCVRSWFVWGQTGTAYVSPEVRVAPNEIMTTYMSYNAPSTTWTIFALNKNQNKPTTLSVTKAKAGNTDYKVAMLVLETIMPGNQCALLPTPPQNVLFTGIKVNGADAPWIERVLLHDCGQKIVQDKTAKTVQFAWTN